jgi:hypothetical protein
MMKKIIKNIDSTNRRTVFTVVGKVTANEFIDAIVDFYNSSVTTNVLWDLIKSDIREISSADVENIVNLSVK